MWIVGIGDLAKKYVCMYVLLCFQISVCCVSLVFLNENQK